MNDAQRKRHEACVKIMVAEKNWEGCGGLSIDDEMKVTIAGQAALLLLGTEGYYFDGVRTVLVYPGSFRRKSNNGWIVDESEHTAIAGEAWQGGPIILSWNDVQNGNRYSHDAYNVVVHEFAHHIDGLDGEMGGQPIFATASDQERWKSLLDQELQKLQNAAHHGSSTVLNYYGATNEAEFFAVANESFFETPTRLQSAIPDIYEMLVKLYQFDPAGWES